MTGEEVASYSVTDIKGMSDSYEKAGAKAFETGVSQLEDEIIPKIIAQIQQWFQSKVNKGKVATSKGLGPFAFILGEYFVVKFLNGLYEYLLI